MSRTPARRGHINWRPFAPDAPFPPPPLILLPASLRAILQLPRGTQSSARAFAERGGLLSSVPRDLSASRESNEKEVWESAFAPSPPLHLPPTSRAKSKPKTVARNSPIPRRFIAFVDRKARRGPHARAPLSLPHQGRDTHREKGQGGGLCAQRIPRRDYFRARFSIPLNSSNAALLLCVRTISAHYLFRLCPWTRSTRDLVGSRFFREMERGNRLERYIYSFSFYFRRMDRWLVDFKKWWFVVVIFSAFLFIFSSKQRRRKCKENVYFFHFDPRGRLLVFYCFVAFPGYCEYILLFILYFLIYPSKDALILKDEGLI